MRLLSRLVRGRSQIGRRTAEGRGGNRRLALEGLEPRCLLAASPITVNGSASGVFVDPQPSAAVVSGVGTNQFTWGVPAEGYSSPCSLGFAGKSFTATPKGKNDYFSLGTLTYYNSMTQSGTGADGVDLDVSLRFRTPTGVRPKLFHFPLELVVYAASVDRKTPAPGGMRWVATADLANEALPNVMRKVIAHALRDGG